MKLEEVLYQGKLYTVVYKYSSGYWEIRENKNKYNVELVHESEVREVSVRPLSF
jgi:hypothetical protein